MVKLSHLCTLQVTDIQQRLQQLQQQLPGVNIEALVAEEPMVLKADMARVLSEVARLMPAADPVSFLAGHPHMVLGMEEAGLPSTLELDGSGLQS